MSGIVLFYVALVELVYCRNRLLAKCVFNTKSDDEYENDAGFEYQTPSLLPVFDSAFTAAANVPTIDTSLTPAASVSPVDTAFTVTASPIAIIDPTLEHVAARTTSYPLTHIDPLDSNTVLHNDPVPFLIKLPDIRRDLEAVDFGGWQSWVASRRIAAVRRWIIYAVYEYGPVDRWGEDFSQEWRTMRHKDGPTVYRWLDSAKQRVKVGRIALSYLERAMEGDLSASVEEWRDLYVQSHDLAGQLWGGVVGVQSRLDHIMLELGPIQPH